MSTGLHPRRTFSEWRERAAYRDKIPPERFAESLRKACLPE
jgi:hypothetical protein